MTIFCYLVTRPPLSSNRQHRPKKILDALTYSVRMLSLIRLNYIVTIATFANLALVTLSVWLFPRQVIFEITSSLAWVLIALQWLIAHKLHLHRVEKLR